MFFSLACRKFRRGSSSVMGEGEVTMTTFINIYSRMQQLLTVSGREGGQAVMEYGMVVTFVAIAALSVFSVLGGIGGEALDELTAVFNPSDGSSLPTDAQAGYRIAD
jgi:Flp pilus assembly pilin Flp